MLCVTHLSITYPGGIYGPALRKREYFVTHKHGSLYLSTV